MCEEFTGKNIGDLCSKYRLTEQMVYQILAGQRAAHTRKIQPGLFEELKGR